MGKNILGKNVWGKNVWGKIVWGKNVWDQPFLEVKSLGDKILEGVTNYTGQIF